MIASNIYLWSKTSTNLRQQQSLKALKGGIGGMDVKGLLDRSCNCECANPDQHF